MFPTFPRTFTPHKCVIVTTYLIYNKTPYILLQILPKPWKAYTIQDGVDGDIFQVWGPTPVFRLLLTICFTQVVLKYMSVGNKYKGGLSVIWTFPKLKKTPPPLYLFPKELGSSFLVAADFPLLASDTSA